MMPGARTPPVSRTLTHKFKNKSPQKATEEAGPSTLSVRKSVGEWEAGKPDNRGTSPVLPASTASRTARGVSYEIGSPPAQRSRVAEARICSNKIKAYMTTSKTTKKEVKEEVKAMADRLYLLIKESEQEKGNEPLTKRTFKTVATQVQEVQKAAEAPPPPPEATNKVEIDSLRRALEEHSRNLADNTVKMEQLKEALQSTQEIMERPSYASVAASRPSIPTQRPTSLHSLVVTAKDATQTGEQVLDRIRKVVNAKEGGIAVEKVRKAKDRKIIVGCRTEEERRKLKERIGKAPELETAYINNKSPQVVLKDVLQYNTNEEILKALRNQNAGIFSDLREEHSKVEVLYRKRTRNPLMAHVVCRVATEVWRRMLEVGAVHVDLQRVRVEDQSPLVQCSLCLGYGHSRRLCTETVPKCGHCGGPHMRSDCADWNAGLPPTCVNCTRAKVEHVNHHAFSSDCSVRKRWDAIARSVIAYC